MGGGGRRVEDGVRGSIEDVLDGPAPSPPPRPKPPDRLPEAAPTRAIAPVNLRVIWGDLCQVEADVHVVGHYQGVMPTSAEAALDAAVSGTEPSRRIIAEHTRRQWFLGDFGHVNYFPSTHTVVRLGAVAGMGRPGTFTEARCTRLAENLLVELCALGTAARVATVGIGSGAGNLSLDQTARALAGGFAAGLQSSRMAHPCTHIDVVEYDRLRAERFLVAFRTAVKGLEAFLTLSPDVEQGTNGGVSFASAAVYALEGMVRGAAAGDGSTEGFEKSLVARGGPDLASAVMGRLREADPDALVGAAEVGLQRGGNDSERPPVRISVLEGANGKSMRVAAITGTATVPERQIDADPKLIDEVVRRMSPPEPAELPWLARLMSRLVLPGDLQALVSADAPLVFEVDRRTAQVHWELIVDLVPSSQATTDGPEKPLILQTSVSRQLRTSYSRVPALDVQTARGLQVLVIGDPGGAAFSLPGARREAEAIHATLCGLGIEVTTLIGAPSDGGRPGPPSDASDAPADGAAPAWRPAARLDVLGELLSGKYQIVHYCGHGTFDPADQRRAGWVFADGLLTSRELAQLGTPPRLVVANACFTSVLGTTGTGRGENAPSEAEGSEAQLTPGLADEFFRSGVTNYVGAAWKVSDADAELFSITFYRQLLGTTRASMGDALTAARSAVWDSHGGTDPPERGTTWAAYQHYGDPTETLVVEQRGPTVGP